MKSEKVPPRRRMQKRSALKKRPAGKPERATTTSDKILGRAPSTAPARGVPAKWRWHYGVLLALQRRLAREGGELLRASAQPIEPHSMHEADSATDEFDHDLALTQLSAEQDALYEVNEALKRIIDGSYGICEETGKAIPMARLRAIPWTRFTQAVKERLEKQGLVRRARLHDAATLRGKGQIWLAPEEEAEEAGETPPAPPNDEALSRVFSPSGPRLPRPKVAKQVPQGTKRKRRRK